MTSKHSQQIPKDPIMQFLIAYVLTQCLKLIKDMSELIIKLCDCIVEDCFIFNNKFIGRSTSTLVLL